MTMQEFSRPFTPAEARRQSSALLISSTAEERASVAQRFDLHSLDALDARLDFLVEGERVTVTGMIHAVAEQRCVATQQPLPVKIDEPLHVVLVPVQMLEADGEEAEVELDDGALDVIGYAGGRFDAGDVIAETLVLALPPFPRAPDADAWLKARGVKSEDEVGSFGALAGLRDQLAASKKGEE